jgi:hypothetical protein
VHDQCLPGSAQAFWIRLFPDVKIVPGTPTWLLSVVTPVLSEIPEALADGTVRERPELVRKP